MPRRDDKPVFQPPPIAIAEPVVMRSRVDKIYDIMLEALISGQNLEQVLETYIPLLLNEMDKLLFLYPDEGPRLLKEIVEGLWVRQFPDIPTPSIEKNDSAHEVFNKIFATLLNHVHKLVKDNRTIRTTMSDQTIARFNTLKFMDAVCSTFFSKMGVSL